MYNTILSQRAAVLVPSESHARIRHASTPARTSFEAQAKGRFLPRLVQRMLRPLAARAAARWELWRQRRDARRTIQALGQLDDYLLRDLGLDRGEIPSIAAGVRGDPRERSPHWLHM